MNRILLGQRLAFGFEGTCIPENFAALVQDGWLLTSGLQKKKSTDCVNNTDAVMNR